MEDSWLLLALRYLQYRPRSIKEVIDYLTRKKASQEDIKKIITRLQEQKLLNDEEFARSWIRTRTALKPTGKYLLRLELIQKGIDKHIIEKILEEAQEESGSDLELAKVLLEKKKEKFINLSREDLFTKAGGFLKRRGFSYDVIKGSIDEVFGS